MLKKHSEFFKTLLFLSDLLIIALCWFFSYTLRFYWDFIPVQHEIPPFKPYLILILPILAIWGFIFKTFNLYRPRRTSTYLSEILDISKACSLAVIVLVALTFFFRLFSFSRAVFFYFWILSILALSISRIIFRGGLRLLRKKGYNLRHILIVGDGVLARDIIQRFKNHPELGFNIIGLITGEKRKVGKMIHGKEVIGTYEEIMDILKDKGVDQVYVALPFSAIGELDNIIGLIHDQGADIKIIPDFYHFLPFCGSVEEFEGLPIFNLQDSPLYGWNIILKRVSDIVISFMAILLTSPLMLLIGLALRLSSGGSVLYKQKRAGLDGKVFNMYKFRTMEVDAERETGPVWAEKNDQRITRFGAILRKTSMDELPQFFNVLKGDMSIVGPRPEREEFIGRFRDHVPRYMLRQKMKAGITGWAQINGWRGNTSIKKRIECDLYYIENWSFLLDIKIIFVTLLKGFVNKNAY